MKRTIRIGKKDVTYSSRKLKGGKTAYYRDGRRVETKYQVRIAKGILSGKTVSQARGHDPSWREWQAKKTTAVEIASQGETLDAWQAPVRNDQAGKELRPYYVLVYVTAKSMAEVGSDKQTEDACVPATLRLRDPDHNDQEGFTYTGLRRNFNRILHHTLKSYRLRLCSGDLYEDVVGFWRHS